MIWSRFLPPVFTMIFKNKLTIMKRALFSLISTLLFIGFQANAQISTERIDSIIRNATTNEFFEGTVLIAENGNVLYQESFGYVDSEETIPVENSMSFGIASITKLFTAITILQLVEEGEIRLDDTLSDLLPELDIPKSKKITVHHLLLHISGLPNENDAIYAQPQSPREFVNKTVKNKANRLGKFNYANIDYVLLGLIIEKVDQMTWSNSVQERILNRAAMAQTGFLSKEKYPSNFAYSFSFNDENSRISDPLFYIENFYSAGCMYSTATDLLKLDQAMYGENLLNEESKQLLYTSYPEYNYSGYSVWTYDYPFAEPMPRVMERRGSILGANSVLIRFLEKNRTVIILSNNNKFNSDSFGNTKNLKEALMIETNR